MLKILRYAIVALIAGCFLTLIFYDSYLKTKTDRTEQNSRKSSHNGSKAESFYNKSEAFNISNENEIKTTTPTRTLFKPGVLVENIGPEVLLDVDDIVIRKFNMTDLFQLTTRVNEKNYSILIKPTIAECRENNSKNPLLLLVVIMVTPESFDTRKLIRSTWTDQVNFKDDLRAVFLLGVSSNSTSNHLIQKESQKHKDILQVDFVDSYFNLTTKVMQGFKWISESCKNVQFILRINDDVVVNTPYLVDYLTRMIETVPTITSIKFMMGKVSPKSVVLRDSGYKFKVDVEDYDQNLFFPYCEGSAILLTYNLAAAVYNLSMYVHMPPFSTWLEDIYIGLLGVSLGAGYIDLSHIFYPGTQYIPYDLVKLNMRPKQSILFAYTHAISRAVYKHVWNYFFHMK
jgi:hypothetical protein